MLASIAEAHGAKHVETLTGFKWLARADDDLPGFTLVYAYEEAIGHCVDPSAVRDKDGISAAVLACDLVAALRGCGSHRDSDALDALALRHGVHTTAAVSVPADAALDGHGSARRHRTVRLAGEPVEVSDLFGPDRRPDLHRRVGARGQSGRREPSQRSRHTSRFGYRRATTWRRPAVRPPELPRRAAGRMWSNLLQRGPN